MSWHIVQEFENKIANFFGSSYAVATDCCTHAIELCLRLQTSTQQISCPQHTYISVPMTFIKLGLNWTFNKSNWTDYYFIENTNIIDAAALWQKGSYVKDSLMCISFQFQKPLSLGRGGMILCSDKTQYNQLKKMSYDGRNITSNIPWADQNITTIGYHYYMTPETAHEGINKIDQGVKDNSWSYKNYPNLSKMKVFLPWTNGVK